MRKEAKLVNILSISSNLLLFCIKIIIGIMTNSIAAISDAMNSFMDSVTGFIIYFCMKVSSKSADADHPFGHHRAEPLAAMLIAVLTAVIGFEILRSAFFRLFGDVALSITGIAFGIYSLTIIIKGVMYFYTKHVAGITGSSALKALMVDHRNDAFISISVILTFVAIRLGYSIVDPLIGFLVSGYIIKSGWEIGVKNIKYVMGETPSKKLLLKIRRKALSVKGVNGVHDTRAHYIGLLLNVEIHIEVDKNMKLTDAHAMAGKVGRAIEQLNEVERAFVHVDPL